MAINPFLFDFLRGTSLSLPPKNSRNSLANRFSFGAWYLRGHGRHFLMGSTVVPRTLPTTDIGPENRPGPKWKDGLPTIHFQGELLVLRRVTGTRHFYLKTPCCSKRSFLRKVDEIWESITQTLKKKTTVILPPGDSIRDLFGMVKWPFKWLSDLQLGGKRPVWITWQVTNIIGTLLGCAGYALVIGRSSSDMWKAGVFSSPRMGLWSPKRNNHF